MHLVGLSERRAEPGFGSEVEMRAERRHLRVGVTHTAAGVAKEREVVALTEAQRVPTDEEAGAAGDRVVKELWLIDVIRLQLAGERDAVEEVISAAEREVVE